MNEMKERAKEKYDDFKEENAIITKLGMYLQCAYESSNKLLTIFHNTQWTGMRSGAHEHARVPKNLKIE